MEAIASTVIVGAGPYGLSVAAHLAARGIRPRVFGVPMGTWRFGMPPGMLLKSEGFASSLSHPERAFTLGDFCAERAIPYRDVGLPVPLEVFAAYGQEFQRRFVPQVEEKLVERIDAGTQGFTLRIAGGEVVHARQVVMATGIGHFGKMPAELAGLPERLITHSSRNCEFSGFAGRHVVVLGAGASALDSAASLQRAGAQVTLVTRRPKVRFFAAVGERNVWARLKAPMSPLGPGWKKLLACKAPTLFHRMPEAFRLAIVKRYLGPAPGWFVRKTIEDHVAFVLNAAVTGAREVNGRVELDIRQTDGTARTIVADHVIAATGYKVEVGRLPCLADALQTRVRCVDGSPKLSMDFESSVPGLFFVGTPSAYDFGPMLRFVAGAELSARRVSRRVAAVERRRSSAYKDRRGAGVSVVPFGQGSSAGS